MIADMSEQSTVGGSPDAQRIADLTRGFFISKICFTALELGVFDLLTQGSMSAFVLAVRLDTHIDATTRLCDALCAVGLLEKNGERYTNSALAQRYLVTDSPAYIGGMALLWSWDAYPLYQHLPTVVREGPRWRCALGKMWADDLAGDPVRLYWLDHALRRIRLRLAEALLDAYEVGAHCALLEVAGGMGEVCLAAARRYPQLRCIFFDQPEVCAAAEEVIAATGLGDRVATWPGDMFRPFDFPRTADLIVLGQVLHNWDDDRALAILRACATALPPGGTLLVREQLLNSNHISPIGTALQNLHMLVIGGGRERTLAEYRELLDEAAFDLRDVRPMAHPFSLVIGRKRG